MIEFADFKYVQVKTSTKERKKWLRDLMNTICLFFQCGQVKRILKSLGVFAYAYCRWSWGGKC